MSASKDDLGVNHGLAGSYSTGCRCAECRKANTERQRRYRAGIRSPWGKGRRPGRVRQGLIAAERLLAIVYDDSDGWSIFGSEMSTEGQEAANELAAALADLGLRTR